MVFVQKKIAVGMDVLAFFTVNDWNFKSDRFVSLVKTQSESEYDMFPIDMEKTGDTFEYLQNAMHGGRLYCAKEPLSTLPRAKILITV